MQAWGDLPRLASPGGFVAVLQHGTAVTQACGKAFYNSLLSPELTELGESYTKAF